LNIRRSILHNVCNAEVHLPCAELVVQGQQAPVGHYFCSPQCIRYFGDSNINNNVIRCQRELLAGQTKADLCILARTLGIKVSMRIPGQGSRDLPKDSIICKKIEKKYVDSHTSGESTAPQVDLETVTIHDNFRLINVMFLDDIVVASDQCGNLATRAELDTSQVGANSPFWLNVTSKFNSIVQDGDPNAEGLDFLDEVHFTHQYYDNHSVTINLGNHNLFSSTKLRLMWNKTKSDYDLAMTLGNNANSSTSKSS
jgi:hypothetical protein